MKECMNCCCHCTSFQAVFYEYTFNIMGRIWPPKACLLIKKSWLYETEAVGHLNTVISL